MSPFSFCAFPSENMTKIFKVENDLLNNKNEKHDLQCVYSRDYLPTTTTLLVLTVHVFSII